MRNIIFLNHTADVKFQAYGKTLEKAFSNSALALKKTISRNAKIKNTQNKKIEVSGKDLTKLFYKFLEEFLYLLDAKNFIFGKIKSIKINKKSLKLTAVILGDKASNYKISNSVKAVTYNEMFVKYDEKTKNFVCQAVLDV